MKCSIMLHFIWIFTVCQSTSLGVSSIQRVQAGTCCTGPYNVHLNSKAHEELELLNDDS